MALVTLITFCALGTRAYRSPRELAGRRVGRRCALRPPSATRAEYHVLVEAATAAAEAAGELMRGASAAERGVQEVKSSSKDLLTQTDVACQACIKAALASRCEKTRFLGEEDVGAGAAAAAAAAVEALEQDGVCWVVDPIDGTANFVDSIPLSTVSIAAVTSGETVAAVVFDPYRRELFAAVKGGGATLNGQPISVSAAATLQDSIVYAGAPPTARALAPSLRGFAAVAPRARTMRLLGSAALMLAYVAAGRGAAYFEADLAAWDTAAGALLIHEAGGKVTDARGAAYRPATTRQIVATNGHIHEEILSVLAHVQGAQLEEEEYPK